MIRGRLLFPFAVDLAQLDTRATEASALGYDDVFDEPKVGYTAGVRQTARVEVVKRVRAQIETTKTNDLMQMPGGALLRVQLRLVLHRADLERDGMIDANGQATIRVNDRIDAVYTLAGQLQHKYPNPPGLFLVQVEPVGFGYGGKCNLIVCWAADREQAKI